MIAVRPVLGLGLTQLISWGVTYYAIGVFGDFIAADLGWSRPLVHGGFSAALLTMGLASIWAGRLIDRYGGRRVMAAGAVLAAAGCTLLALAQDLVLYYGAWICLGLAMRLTLYDAAFATLARNGGEGAKRAMAQITLLGGLASTVFWPLGQGLAEGIGWRGGLLVYAGFALLTLPLLRALPEDRSTAPAPECLAAAPALADLAGDSRLAGLLYALIMGLVAFLASGMSAHMIAILGGLGLAASAAVWAAALRGLGQSLARLGEVLLGSRLHPLRLNLLALFLLPPAFLAGLWSGQVLAFALAFALLYGAGNGLATITRGTVPLVLFERRGYGARVGRLLLPSFLLAAAAPLFYAAVIEAFGAGYALLFSASLATTALAAAVVLCAKARPAPRP